MEKNVEFWKATEHILRTVHPDEDWSLFVEILNEFKKDTFKKLKGIFFYSSTNT